MRFLDLIEQHHGIRLSSDCLGQLTALVVAHITRRRSDQAGHGELLHVLRHVESHHGALIVKERRRKALCKLSLADTGGTEEEEGADGLRGILDARLTSLNGLRNLLHGLILTHDPLMQGVVQVESLILLRLGELGHRNIGPAGDDLCNLVLRDCLMYERKFLPLHLGLLLFELLFKLRELAVLELGRLIEVIALLCALNLAVRVLDLLANLRKLRDARLFVFPLCLRLGKGFLLLRKLLLDGRQSLLREIVGLLPECRRLNLKLHAAAVHLIEFRRQRVELGLNHCAGFIDQVDCLVGQEAVGDIAVRKHGRADQCAVLNFHVVVVLVALL